MFDKILTFVRRVALLVWALCSGGAAIMLFGGYVTVDPMHGREHARTTQVSVQTQTAADGTKLELRQEVTQEIEQFPARPDSFARSRASRE